jgi:putative flippase GtrA
MGQFLSFALVGAFGFLVDAGVLSLALLAGLGFYAGRLVSYLAAATFTWFCNRTFTFQSTNGSNRKAEWLRFVLWNAAGGAANLGVYAVLIAQGGVFVRMPALAVAAGSLSGLIINFLASKLFVFRASAERDGGRRES